MTSPPRSTLLVPLLLAALACSPDPSLLAVLEARLSSLREMVRDDVSPDEQRRALDRQLRIAPVPTESAKSPSASIFPTRETLIELYDRRGRRLAWIDDSGELLASATTAIDALRRAGEHGLHPEDYALDRLDRMVTRIGKGPLDEAAIARLADFDLLLTAAFLRYASDLSTGRVHPDEVRGEWHTNPPELDLVAALARALERDELAQLLEALPPPHPGYRRLREALAGLRELPSAPAEPSVEQRILALELNLERWRWIPRGLGDSYVVVNIPGFDLGLVQDGAVTWRTRVVAGKAYTPTPVFSDRIVAVVANPPWNVPESIAAGEYLPKLREDPSSLARQHIRVFEGTWEEPREVDPTSVDWNAVNEEDFPYRLRQDPGADAALGRVKFDLTNDFHIYLHDTPAGHLFDRTERDLSHGCIRVEHPTLLAELLLEEPTAGRLREALEQQEELRLPVEPPVPVHILYWTAWVEESGVVRFGPDVYGLDETQRIALEKAALR